MNTDIRFSQLEDRKYLAEWLSDPETLQWFPMINTREIEDAVNIWLTYTRFNACFTAWVGDIPIGMTILYVQPYQKYRHQALFAIIVNKQFRNQGIGKILIDHLSQVALNDFNLQFLHLEVYDGNPAIRLYERSGFKEYGRHPHFIKTQGTYVGKILMQKRLQ